MVTAAIAIAGAVGSAAAAVGGAVAAGAGALASGIGAVGTGLASAVGAAGGIGTLSSVASTGLSIAGAIQGRNDARRAATSARAQNAASREQRELELQREQTRLRRDERNTAADILSGSAARGLAGASVTQGALVSERATLQREQDFLNQQQVMLANAAQTTPGAPERIARQFGTTPTAAPTAE